MHGCEILLLWCEKNSQNHINNLFFDPRRYDLTKVGRFKYNDKLSIAKRIRGQIASDNIINPETGEVLVSKDKMITDEEAEAIQEAGINEVTVKVEDKLVKAQIEDIRIKNGTLLPNEVRKGYGQEPIYNTDLIPSTQKNLNMYKNALEHEGLLKQEGFKNYYGKDTGRWRFFR